MSDERDETRSFSPFDDATWADDATGPARGERSRRPPRPSDRTRPGARPQAGDRTQADSQSGAADRTQADNQSGAGDRAQADDRSLAGDRAQADDRSLAGDRTQADSRTQADDWTRPRSAASDDPTRTPEGRDRSQVPQPDDATVIDGPAGRRPADATAVMPPASGSPAWSGRAEVRAPRPGQTSYQEVDDWPVSPEKEPRDRWWMPILVGILVLVLLAALGWGIYLIVQNVGKNNSPTPAVTTSAPPAPSTAVTTRTTPPSTAPTTTSTPSPTPSTTTNPTRQSVTIPALRGLSVADAKSALLEAGISAIRVIYRASTADAGTVIDSNPEEGQEIPPDTTVTLVVAAPSVPTTTAAPSTATTTGN